MQRTTTQEQLGGLVSGQDVYTECKKLGFPAGVGLCGVVEKRKSLALAGGRSRYCQAEFRGRFGVDIDVLWSFTWARCGGGKTDATWRGVTRTWQNVLSR